jgi:hypothetical protein
VVAVAVPSSLWILYHIQILRAFSVEHLLCCCLYHEESDLPLVLTSPFCLQKSRDAVASLIPNAKRDLFQQNQHEAVAVVILTSRDVHLLLLLVLLPGMRKSGASVFVFGF